MSLYRKYRPKVFADVYGQEHVVGTLESATEHDKLVHAYLFAGTRGTGKTSVARILAKILMTRGIEDAKLKKQIEQAVDEGNTIDLLEIDAASNRKIDDARDLIEKIQFSPVVASAKVYIIDEAHMLTKEAFNALLKTLEEPPAYAYFILATTELHKIPDTIKSRCQCFPFRQIKDNDIVRRLQFIADQEHIKVDREALRTIAEVSNGGMRDAISLLDQMRSLAHITVAEVKERTGATGREYVEEVFAALDARAKSDLIAGVRKMEEAGVPLDMFIRQLLKILRENLHDRIQANEGTNDILHIMDLLLVAIRDMRLHPVPGLVLESALLTLCETSGMQSAASMPKKQQMSKSMPDEAPQPEIVPETAPVTIDETETDLRLRNAAVEAPEVTLDSVRRVWPVILKEASPPSVKMSLKNGRVTGVGDNIVSLSFASAFHMDKVGDTEASRALEAILEKHFKKQLKLRCSLESSGAEPATCDDGELVNMADAAAEIF